MVDIIMKGVVAITLLLTTIQDFCYKKISIWIVTFATIVLLICLPFGTTFDIGNRIGGVMVGIAMILLSKLTQGKIGIGDGLLLCVTGLLLGFWSNMELLAIALFVASVLSIVLLALRLVNRKHSIPFVPFLFVAYLIIVVFSS